MPEISNYKKVNRILLILLSVLLVMLVYPSNTFADESKVNSNSKESTYNNNTSSNPRKENLSGTFGTSEWYLTEDGVLHFGPGEFAVRPSFPHHNNAPWSPDLFIQKIVFDGDVKANSNSQNLFSQFSYLTEIENLDKLDVSQTTNMQSMFSQSDKLIKADVSKWDTSKVESMFALFMGASSLEIADVSNWNTENVTNMSFMFDAAHNLKIADVSNWNTSNVRDMYSLFSDTNSLNIIDVSNWDTGNVISMGNMFVQNFDKPSFTHLDVSKWNVSKVQDMTGMFYGQKFIEELDVSNWDTSSVINMGHMFRRTALKNVDVSNWNTSNVTSMSYMFESVKDMSVFNLSSWDTSNVEAMNFLFFNTASSGSLDISNWNTRKVFDFTGIFAYTEYPLLDIASWDTSEAIYMEMMFENSNVEDLDLSAWNTEKVISMRQLFAGATNLKRLNLSGWNTQSILEYGFESMFSDTLNLSELTLGKDFHFNVLSYPDLQNITPTNMFTGKWINVGDGTINSPSGENVWTSEELMELFDGSKHADTYVWQKEQVIGQVIVKYQDIEGLLIHDSISLIGEVGLPFATESISIPGWTLIEVPSNSTGVFSVDLQEVVYIYEKDVELVTPGPSDPDITAPEIPSQPDPSIPDTDLPTNQNQGNESLPAQTTDVTHLPQTGVSQRNTQYLVIIGLLLILVKNPKKKVNT